MVAVTYESWTCTATEPYVTVTLHFITDECAQKKSKTESPMSASVAELQNNVAEQWEMT